MKKLFGSLFVLFSLALAFWALPTEAAQVNCDGVFATSSIPDLTTKDFSFNCGSSETVYFGACDSGNVPNDDYFEVTFNGQLVSYNRFSGTKELVGIGKAQTAVGNNVATLVSKTTTPFPPATYSIAISSDRGAIIDYLVNPLYCGEDVDFTSFFDVGDQGCLKAVPLFTTDGAPSNGIVEMRVQFGEQNRTEGYTVRKWDVVAGKQINNEFGLVPAPKWVRVWWQPSGDSDWYLLPSQYWAGGGTIASEYGVSCDDNGVPSYHTSFGAAIPEADVPLFITQ